MTSLNEAPGTDCPEELGFWMAPVVWGTMIKRWSDQVLRLPVVCCGESIIQWYLGKVMVEQELQVLGCLLPPMHFCSCASILIINRHEEAWELHEFNGLVKFKWNKTVKMQQACQGWDTKQGSLMISLNELLSSELARTHTNTPSGMSSLLRYFCA